MAGKKTGKNLADVQEINRSLVLNTLRENPNCSRSFIAQSTGLRQATITNIVNDFIQWGIVIETSLLRNTRGRRSIGLCLNSDRYRVICLRLQRTNLLAGLYDISGKEYHTIRKDLDVSRGAEAAIEVMIQVIRQLKAETGDSNLLGIGVGLPGPYLKKEGVITVMADFPGWEGHAIQVRLEEEFGDIVFTEHDAHANGLAEWWFGGQRGEEHVLLSISMEEGLGAGLIADGKVYYGEQGIGGEIGHISIDYNGIPCPCGSRGCLRNYCSDVAVVRQAIRQLHSFPDSVLNRIPDGIQLSQIIDAALSGDSFAESLIREAGTYLGYGLVSVIYMYNPGIIVLSRQFAAAGDLFLDAVRKVLNERLAPALSGAVRLVFSRITEDPVLMGMVALVTDAAFMTPASIIQAEQGQTMPSSAPLSIETH